MTWSFSATGAKAWLRSRAKQLRRDMTPAEKTVWRILHEGELIALNWRRQAPFGDFILDFVSHPARLVVEVDGAQHAETDQASYDARRTGWLESHGYRVLRVWNSEAKALADGVWQLVYHAAAQSPAMRRMERWREQTHADIRAANDRALTSSSMEEVARAQRGSEEVRAQTVSKEPQEARSSTPEGAPPQSVAGATDSSSIEEERGAGSEGAVS